MSQVKTKVLSLQEEIIDTLHTSSIKPSAQIALIQNKMADALAIAQQEQDGLTQLYCCMAEAHLNSFLGSQSELVELFESLTKTNTNFILAKEKGSTYNSDTLMLDADTYGLYYALNDHYSQLWDREDYKLSKNGNKGNPLITNLIKICYEDDNGFPVYNISEDGHVEKDSMRYRNNNILREELFKSFRKYNTKIFSDMSIAFVGGAGDVYEDIVIRLGRQFNNKDFLNFSPNMGAPGLNISSATHVHLS
jgi:hypothetical protein